MGIQFEDEPDYQGLKEILEWRESDKCRVQKDVLNFNIRKKIDQKLQIKKLDFGISMPYKEK